VVACNTASAAALDELRILHPDLPIVGMEPAVKPAADLTTSGVIAVFATAATFQGRLFESVVSRFGKGASVITRACPEWVELVEAGILRGPKVEAAVARWVGPAIEAGADALVLGCTHFSFLRPVIEEMAGEGVTVIDPAPAVALQTARVARESDGSGTVTLAASGDLRRFAELANELAGLHTGSILHFP
jgi:glutamate racemase